MENLPLLWLILIAALVFVLVFIYKRRPTQISIDLWSLVLKHSDRPLFLKMVGNTFTKKGVPVTIHAEEGYAVDAQGFQYAFANLAQTCAQAERSAWPDIIASHIDRVLEFKRRGSFSELEQITDYEAMRPRLAIRLYNDHSSFTDVGKLNLTFRRDLEGTITALVFDLPDSVRNITPEEARAWHKPANELFTAAFENTFAAYTPKLTKAELRGMDLWLITGDDIFVTTQVFRLETFPGLVGAHGALVGIPTRNLALCYALGAGDASTAVHLMIPLIQRTFTEGPGSITPNLYWYHQGKFTLLPYTISNNQISFNPPKKFVNEIDRPT